MPDDDDVRGWDITERSDGSVWIKHAGRPVALMWRDPDDRFLIEQDLRHYIVTGITAQRLDDTAPWEYKSVIGVQSSPSARLVDGEYDGEAH